uniref:EF-hand domain-containing protein n=1 Tax=Strigamia maritima TaxID=126957 RepID=T1J9B1_STRMM
MEEMFEEDVDGENVSEGDSINFYPVEELFCMYARFGDARGSGDMMCLKNFEKWLKQANIKTVTPIEAVMHFSKVAKGKKGISYKEFLEAVDRLACQKQVAVETLKQKLVECGPPLPTNPTEKKIKKTYNWKHKNNI